MKFDPNPFLELSLRGGESEHLGEGQRMVTSGRAFSSISLPSTTSSISKRCSRRRVSSREKRSASAEAACEVHEEASGIEH